MGHQRERESFLISMAKHGMSADVARLILRHAQAYHRLSERECNGDDWCQGDTAMAKRCGYLVKCPNASQDVGACSVCEVRDLNPLVSHHGHEYVTKSSVRMSQIERRIRELCSCDGKDGMSLEADFQGDPRGYEVRILVMGTRNVIGVPRKG